MVNDEEVDDSNLKETCLVHRIEIKIALMKNKEGRQMEVVREMIRRDSYRS